MSTCGTGDVEPAGAEEDWSAPWVGWVEVLSPVAVPSCLDFLPRLKMPLKTRLTMLAASGAADALGAWLACCVPEWVMLHADVGVSRDRLTNARHCWR